MTDDKSRENLARYLMSTVLNKCTGAEITRVYDDRPSKKFFIGTLNPKTKNQPQVFTKVSPCQMGISGLVAEEKTSAAVLKIRISGVFYQRVFPSYEEQLEAAKIKYPPLSAEEEGIEHEEAELKEEGTLREGKFREVYQKTERLNLEIEKKLTNITKPGESVEMELPEVKRAVEELKRVVCENPNAFLDIRKRENKIVPLETLETQSDYQEYVRKVDGSAFEQEWDLTCRIKTSPFRGQIKITATLENAVEQEKEPQYLENSFFESSIEMELEGADFQPYVLDYLSEDYRFDGNIEADGINCSTEKLAPNIIASSHVPIFIQKRYKSSNKIKTEFKSLIGNPVGELRKIESEMNRYKSELEALFAQKEHDLTEKGKMPFKHDIRDYQQCIDRFKYGIDLLEMQTPVGKAALEAFKLMNQSFLSSAKDFESWHLFQVVFITSLIPDMVSVHEPGIKNYRDHVDLIYFPTGGGKTEAYLGIVVMQIFFDRLMGKKAGVSAITRFPLRLLSLQQLQRIADIFAQAEKIRRVHPIISGSDYAPFSTGYFVGGDNTPNKIDVETIRALKDGEIEKDRYRIITKCPFCHKKDSVEIEINESSLRIEHVCKNEDCAETILPIYISDYEIFRYLPTFIVGTIDKNASCARQRYFRHIFGQVTHYCPDHGYLSGSKCLQRTNYPPTEGCRREPEEYTPVNLFDPTPSLLIQDELHLIRGSLGSYSSHYESFLDDYMKRITGGKKRLKVIGATATIQQFEHQVEQLYKRSGIKFPPSTPNLKKSFFAYEDENETARFIIGVMPHNKTIIFAVLDILKYYHEEIQRLQQNPKRLTQQDIAFSSVDKGNEALEEYKLLLSYNLVKLEGDAVTQSVKTMINPRLREEGLDEMSVQTMTGDVTFSDVREVLSIVEDKGSDRNIDLITATSMISHGVDLDALNFMVFRGMPRSTAEYIQAHSRVGRKYPGIVFIVFNHTRERDQSHYKYFQKFHEFQSILVEPVPINRWAKFSINRTLPGIFSAALLNYYGLKAEEYGLKDMHMAKYFAKAYSERKITEDEIKQFIHDSYGTDTTDLAHHFKHFIERKLEQYIGEILDKRDVGGLKAFIPSTLSDPPMISLRDTDIPIEVSPMGESYEPMKRVSSMRTRGGD